eukprot:scaffold46095_cov70-Attheya_sp.AAC.7
MASTGVNGDMGFFFDACGTDCVVMPFVILLDVVAAVDDLQFFWFSFCIHMCRVMLVLTLRGYFLVGRIKLFFFSRLERDEKSRDP